MSAAAEKVKHYGFALATVYMCYFTYGIQALILSQNKVNFYTQWGITHPTAGSAAVSMAIAAMGFGKLLSVWIGGEPPTASDVRSSPSALLPTSSASP